MNLKLRYHISAKTSLSVNNIAKRVQDKLHMYKYTIVQVDKGVIEFKDNPWALRWNFAPFKLDGGEFTVVDDQLDERLVTVSYYVNFLQPLLFLIFLIISALTVGAPYEAMLFFLAFFIVAMTIENFRARWEAKALLAEILGTGVGSQGET